MRTLGKWLAIAVGIYLAIAVVMNAVEPARREKEARAAQAAANLEQRQAEKAAKEATGKAKRLEECAGFPDGDKQSMTLRPESNACSMARNTRVDSRACGP
jgi:hypothetical protein